MITATEPDLDDDPRATWQIVVSFLVSLVALVGFAVAFLVGAWRASDGRYDEGAFWLALAIVLRQQADYDLWLTK